MILPKLVLFSLMDALTERRCEGGSAPDLAALACPRGKGGAAGACAAAGGKCVVVRDGFFLLSYVMIGFGLVLFLWLRRVLPKLEALPTEAWRAKPPRRQL